MPRGHPRADCERGVVRQRAVELPLRHAARVRDDLRPLPHALDRPHQLVVRRRAVDAHDAGHEVDAHLADALEALQRIGYLKTDANTIISAAFAIGTLMASLKKHDKAQGANLVMYALLLCVAFVMPTSDVPATSRISILIRSSQKVCLNYAIGFILAGISLDLVN